jgi:N-methylhydantoinase A
MEDEATQILARAGIARDGVEVTRHLDMRYRGQGYEIEVALPRAANPAELHATLPRLFASAYERVFSLSYLDAPVEILNWKVDVSGPPPRFDSGWSTHAPAATGPARKGARRAYFPEAGGYVECPVYDRYALRPGTAVDGPAIIEERESTCVLGVDDRARVDEFGNLVAEIGAQP